jgi:heme exporter protein D
MIGERGAAFIIEAAGGSLPPWPVRGLYVSAQHRAPFIVSVTVSLLVVLCFIWHNRYQQRKYHQQQQQQRQHDQQSHAPLF